MVHRATWVILAFLVFSCKDDKVRVTIHSNEDYFIVDSTPPANVRLHYYSRRFQLGYYPVFYQGKISDTIRLGAEEIIGYRTGDSPRRDPGRINVADSIYLKLTVDTSICLSFKGTISRFDEDKQEYITELTQYFEAYPIFFSNNSDSPFIVGKFSELGKTIRQAKDERGNWVDIELPMVYGCGTGAREIIIEPNELLVAKMIRYEGDYKTQCRLKFSTWYFTLYSNTFVDYISKRQLIEPLIPVW